MNKRINLESESSGDKLTVAGGVFRHTNGHWSWQRGCLTAFGLVGDLQSLRQTAVGDASNTGWLSIDVGQLEHDLGGYVLKHLGTAATALNTERVRFNDNR